MIISIADHATLERRPSGAASSADPGTALSRADLRSEDADRVALTARRLEPLVAERLRPYPLVRPVALPQICLNAAATDPDLDPAVQTELCLFMTLVCALDDQVDAPRAPHPQQPVSDLLDLCALIVHGAMAPHAVSDPAWHQTLTLLAENCRALQAFPQAAGCYPSYREP